jgi:DNA-binding NarL/FixJ family response regulator
LAQGTSSNPRPQAEGRWQIRPATSVLLVDDGTRGRELLGTILRHDGYDVLHADTRAGALGLARSGQPDLIIADVLMPTMDGYELARELREEQATAGIPVIFYTANYLMEEVRELAGDLGVQHILVESSEPDEILRMVSEAILHPHGLATAPPPKDFHREHLRILTAGLLQKVDEIRETVLLASFLQRESHTATDGTKHERPSAFPGDERLAELSERERDVLGLIVEGATNGEIAARLVIAPSTVQTHVKRILNKLGVKNRTEAAVRYVRG